MYRPAARCGLSHKQDLSTSPLSMEPVNRVVLRRVLSCRRPRLLGAGPGSRVPPGHVFGKPSAREPEPCVCELIRGTGSQQGPLQQQQQSAGVDPGLGKSLTRWRNTSETAERVGATHTF